MTKFKIFVETLTVCTLFVRSNLDKVGLRKLVLKKLVQTHANRHKRTIQIIMSFQIQRPFHSSQGNRASPNTTHLA